MGVVKNKEAPMKKRFLTALAGLVLAASAALAQDIGSRQQDVFNHIVSAGKACVNMSVDGIPVTACALRENGTRLLGISVPMSGMMQGEQNARTCKSTFTADISPFASQLSPKLECEGGTPAALAESPALVAVYMHTLNRVWVYIRSQEREA